MALEELYNQSYKYDNASYAWQIALSSPQDMMTSQASSHHADDVTHGSFASGKTVSFAEPTISRAALSLINGRNKPLVTHLLELIVKERHRSNILPKLLEVNVHVDSETGKKLLHIKQTVATDANRALAYWDKISPSIDYWIQTLPRDQKEFVLDNIYMTIHWTG